MGEDYEDIEDGLSHPRQQRVARSWKAAVVKIITYFMVFATFMQCYNTLLFFQFSEPDLQPCGPEAQRCVAVVENHHMVAKMYCGSGKIKKFVALQEILIPGYSRGDAVPLYQKCDIFGGVFPGVYLEQQYYRKDFYDLFIAGCICAGMSAICIFTLLFDKIRRVK